MWPGIVDIGLCFSPFSLSCWDSSALHTIIIYNTKNRAPGALGILGISIIIIIRVGFKSVPHNLFSHTNISLIRCWREESKEKFYEPFGSKLFFLVHVMLGIGLPLAEHSNRTGAPFFTCMWPPDVTWFIFGGTFGVMMNIKVFFVRLWVEKRRKKERNETLN